MVVFALKTENTIPSFFEFDTHFYAALNPYGAGIDFRRQNLMSKVDPRTEIIESTCNGRRPIK